jgi:hypothetical protein
VLTFPSSGPELDALSRAGHPFFKPVWFPDIVGLVLDADVRWDEVHRNPHQEPLGVLAPNKLVELVHRPPD